MKPELITSKPLCPLMDEDKRLVAASWWEGLAEGIIWWARPCSVNLSCNFLLMGGAVFPPCSVPRGQTMAGVMATSFRKTYASMHTSQISAPDPAAGHCQPTPLPDSQTCPGESGSVSCGVTAPFSRVLVHERFCLCLASFSIRGRTEWKPQSQKANQTDHMDQSLVYLNETRSHAVQGHLHRETRAGEFRQNVVH